MPSESTTTDRAFDAIVFDFSGVMVSSAFTAIGSAAADHDMDEDAFIEYLLGPYSEDTDHAWHKAERGEIGITDWITDTMSRAEADGLGLDLGFMASMLGELEVYDVMVDAARTLRSGGYRTALLTNNIAEGRDSWRPMLPLDDLFDDVVDSSEVGMRKPNPMIYRLVLDRLGGVAPERAIMLDDHPGNCGGARHIGMQAILVDDPDVAVDELHAMLGERP